MSVVSVMCVAAAGLPLDAESTRHHLNSTWWINRVGINPPKCCTGRCYWRSVLPCRRPSAAVHATSCIRMQELFTLVSLPPPNLPTLPRAAPSQATS